MAWQWCRLMLAACALSALVTSGSTRTTNDDGICTRVIQFVAFEGQRAVGGTTLTYRASERKFREAADEVCCNGWRRDPDSEKLRCIKIDPNDSAGVGGADIVTDLGNGEESSVHRVWNALKKEAGLQSNVRRPRDSPSASENTSAGSSQVNTGQSASNVSDGHSVQNPEQGLQNQAAKGDGKAVSGAGQSSQANSAAAAAAAADPKGDQPVGPPSSNSDGTQSEPNTASNAASSRDAPHTSGEKQNPPGSSQEPSKNGSLPQAASTSSHPEGPPHAVPSESKSSATSHSATDHSDVAAQTPAEKEHNDQRGDSSQTRGTAGSVSSSAAMAPSAATTVAPQAKDPIVNQTVDTKVQPQSTPSNLSGPIAHPETTASPVAITPSESKGSASPEMQGNNDKTANNPVVSVSVHPDQTINLTVQSTRDAASVQPTSKDRAHRPREDTVSSPGTFQSTSAPAILNPTVLSPQDTNPLTLTKNDLANTYHEDTIPSTGSFQSTSAPSISTTTTTTTTSTTTNLTNTSSNPTQKEVNATHPAESENSVHTGQSTTLGTIDIPITTSATTKTGSTESISRGGTTAARVASTTRVPASHQSNMQPDNTTVVYNVMMNTSSGIKSTTQGTSTGKSSVATGQQGNVSAANTTEVKVNGTSGANCSLFEHQKNCSDSNDTTSAVRSQSPPAPSVAKPHAGGATVEPSDGSASKTASEVTISLLLVAAVAFVAGLLYWRTRRRRRRYINCGTREPNLHFSNPVYDLEAMMEQTSLVKLQNAADIEDGDGSDADHEAASQRK